MSLHIGYGGAVKKVKAIYAGVNGAVKKVKAVYGGVSNAVRLLWRGDVLDHHAAPAMTDGKYEPAAAVAGAYAVVFGGGTGTSFLTKSSVTAEAYTAELVHITDVASFTPPGTASARNSNAASVGGYAIFSSGMRDRWDSIYSGAFQNYTHAYSDNLTFSEISHAGRVAYRGTASFAGYAVLGGGQRYGTYYMPVNEVAAYDGNLTRSLPASLSEARRSPGAAESGGVLLFVGGDTENRTKSSVVDVYSPELAAQTPGTLSFPPDALTVISAAVSLGDCALFAPGEHYGTSGSKYIFAFRGSVQLAPIKLDASVVNCAGTAVGEYAVFAGGCNYYSPYDEKSDVHVFNKDLVLCSAPPLVKARGFMAAATVGGKAMFFGGTDGNSALGAVDAYSVAN